MSRSATPVLVYDADCAFCQRWVARWRARTGDAIDDRPLQEPGLLRRLGVPLSAASRSVQLVTPAGARYEGAEAVFRLLGRAPGLRLLARLARLPVARGVAASVYRVIARHRALAARVDALLFGRSTAPPGAALVRAVFLRALGGVYLVAFASLRRQVLGLYGARGIAPIREHLEVLRLLVADRVRPATGEHRDDARALDRLRLAPTVFWLGASDAALVRACVAGQLLAVALMLGLAPRLTSATLWALYLSFVTVGRELLAFQWDALLLETGLAATLIAPPGLRMRRALEAPPWTAIALMRGLVFRLYFESGLCKLASGDPAWRTFTACRYHYGTQPLPTRLGWYAHQLPRSIHRVSTFAALALELVAPFFAWAPRRPRRAAFVALATLQSLISATGNHGFFNLLAVVDSLWLLDDETLARALRRRRPPVSRAPWWRRAAIALGVAPLLALSGSELATRVRRRARMPRVLARLHAAVAPFHVTSPYGPFAVMTTERPEIVIEGSDDGVTWREYRFRYKAGDVNQPPRWVAPHRPRLDWQMWFAALGYPPPWFMRLLARLLEGVPEVLALLDGNPFPEHPPT